MTIFDSIRYPIRENIPIHELHEIWDSMPTNLRRYINKRIKECRIEVTLNFSNYKRALQQFIIEYDENEHIQ